MASKPDLTAARDVYLNLVRAHEKLHAEFTALFREHGLTQAQYNVLRILLGGPKEGAPCQYVGERLLNRVPDVTRLIDRMETAGLVERERSAEDRRVVLVRVTAEGGRLCERLRRPVADLHRRQLAHMSPRQVEALSRGLQQVLSTV
ncbi:MAG: MarR family transcriptional regulator [Planctomycetota bacterium]